MNTLEVYLTGIFLGFLRFPWRGLWIMRMVKQHEDDVTGIGKGESEMERSDESDVKDPTPEMCCYTTL